MAFGCHENISFMNRETKNLLPSSEEFYGNAHFHCILHLKEVHSRYQWDEADRFLRG